MKRGLTDLEINEMLRGEAGFQGCFMRNDARLPQQGCYILNLDEREDPGTHWTAVYHGEYYDPFGLPPPQRLAHLTYNRVQHQSMNSHLCGLYCMYYIFQRNRGVSAYDLSYLWLKRGGNKKELLRWLEQTFGTV